MCYFKKKKVHFEKQDSYLSHKWIFCIQPLRFIEHAIVYLAKKKKRHKTKHWKAPAQQNRTS